MASKEEIEKALYAHFMRRHTAPEWPDSVWSKLQRFCVDGYKLDQYQIDELMALLTKTAAEYIAKNTPID